MFTLTLVLDNNEVWIEYAKKKYTKTIKKNPRIASKVTKAHTGKIDWICIPTQRTDQLPRTCCFQEMYTKDQ